MNKTAIGRQVGVSRRTFCPWIASGQLDRELDEEAVRYEPTLARNSRLVERICWQLADAQAEAERTGRSAGRFTEFPYANLTSWSCQHRVVAKAE